MAKWKNIPWFIGYKVSRQGTIKSFKNNRHWLKKEWVLMKARDDTNWYLVIWLRNPWTKAKMYKIHKIVMDTFIWPANWLDVNHKNWNKYDNRLCNLEYCTRWENLQHKYRVLKCTHPNKWKFWKLHHSSKKVKQLDKKHKYIKTFNWLREAERITWVNWTSISWVCRWKRKTAWGFIWRYI